MANVTSRLFLSAIACVALTLVSRSARGVDALNTNLTILACLDKVERALICHEPTDAGDRNAILRTIGAVRLPLGGDWFNCMAADASVLRELMDFEN